MSNEKYSNTKEDSKVYSSGYEAFLKRTNFREVIICEFSKQLGKCNFPTTGSSIRILDLGCGNGAMTQKYVEAVSEVYKEAKIELDLVEPAPGALDEAKKRFENLGNSLRSYPVSAESFIGKLNNIEKFYDIIICSYIFYHVSADIIRPLTSHLSEHGVMMISMGSHEHPLRNYPPLRAVSKHGDSNIIENAISRDTIDKEFEVVKIELRTDLNLLGLMENDNINPEGQIFFSFIYNTDLENFITEQMVALKATVTESYLTNNGIVHPIHNMYWFQRSNA